MVRLLTVLYICQRTLTVVNEVNLAKDRLEEGGGGLAGQGGSLAHRVRLEVDACRSVISDPTWPPANTHNSMFSRTDNIITG